ncbi:hypothetical protein P4O66_017438 [Electrophorus voltai]|uniref:Protein kinase domain-containing protein n=1 Tax=Electrophorus voltai TaxID=2609070 RepID=A0AAD8YWB3_9TELE|nr:hypothetical protein P4O66_017438 [Electrophorus voltai]
MSTCDIRGEQSQSRKTARHDACAGLTGVMLQLASHLSGKRLLHLLVLPALPSVTRTFLSVALQRRGRHSLWLCGGGPLHREPGSVRGLTRECDPVWLIRHQVRVLEQRLAGEESACVSVLSRGDCFGERELKGEAIRLLSAVALGDVTCLVTDRESIQRFMGAEDNSRECESGEPKAKPEVGGAELCDVSSSDVQVLCNLGEGRFGHTQLVHLKEDASRMLALRIIRKSALVSPSQRERVLAEKQITMDAHCPFIVRGPFEESVTCFYTACVLEALACLHDRGVVHRDLKPENVLLDQRGYAKLVWAWSFCGSPGHQAPEVILQKGHSLPADLWGLGVLVYELLNGSVHMWIFAVVELHVSPILPSPPFTGADLLKTCAAVLKGIDAVEFPRSISRAAAELVKGLCREDPSKRLGCGTLLKDVRGHNSVPLLRVRSRREPDLSSPVTVMDERIRLSGVFRSPAHPKAHKI